MNRILAAVLAVFGATGATLFAGVAFVAMWLLTPRNALTPDALPYFSPVLWTAAVIGATTGIAIGFVLARRNHPKSS